VSEFEPSFRTRAIASGGLVLLRGGLALIGIALVLASACGRSATEKLEDALVGRGRVVVLGGDDLVKHTPQGVELVPVAKFPDVDRALAGDDDRALANAMQASKVAGVLVDARRGAISPGYKLGARIASYASFEALQGAYLSPRAALYVLDPVRAWSQEIRTGIALVARRLVGGEQPPHVRSFPDVMRRMEPAEVMVLLRLDGRARLWRSARGTSFARALLTAAEVARQRWIERSQAMGGPLNEILPKMQVEVSLLQDDGEIGSTDESFVNRVVLPVHGVAFEHKGAWRYLLPEATHTKELKTPYQAYERLFADDGLPDDSLDSQELRPYRMIVKVIGISAAQKPSKRREPKDGLSEVKSPDEVLVP
jgi:hypothetical protein